MNLFKLLFCTAFILASVLCTHGQDKKRYISVEDSSFYTLRYGKHKDTHLPEMRPIREGRAWRFWYDKYIAASFIIDVRGSDSTDCKAFITMYTYGDVVWNDQNKFSKVYYKEITLDPDVARELYKAASQVQVARFSRRDTLEGSIRMWDTIDGFPYTVEYSDEKAYYFKTGLQSENKLQFESAIKTATEFINFEKLKDDFEKNVPFGYYGSGKWMFMRPKRSPKQIRQYKQYWEKRAEQKLRN